MGGFLMMNVFESCRPREEVLKGELREEMFAAKLRTVMEGSSDRIYQDPDVFFRNTYPTEGLKTLTAEVFGRLSGKNPYSNPFIRLETSFGGGKTHNLIALYHLASGHMPNGVLGLIYPEVLPRPEDNWNVAGVVGSDMQPQEGTRHGEITTHTLWGEIAWQLAGRPGYELVRQSDEQMVAPGTQLLEMLAGDKPTLIMLDELSWHLRQAKAINTPNEKSNLAEQTVSFLMSLIDFAASQPRVSVVLTLADSTDAFGGETDEIHLAIQEAKKVSARQELVITPTGEAEISSIVTHRLFEHIDRDSAEKTADGFIQMYRDLESRGVALPAKAVGNEYRKEILQNYPFHPELLLTLNRKTSTIPNFQKTRGALRLLARVVRELWEKKPENTWLIHPHHIDLSVPEIVGDFTSRLDRPAFKSVVESDIVSPLKGSEAHCTAIDHQLWLLSGKPPYAQRLATCIFVNSLTRDTASGIEPEELVMSVIEPGTDPEHLKRSLSVMLAEERLGVSTACWFLHYDGRRYKFKTEPSLEMIVQQEMGNIGRTISKNALDEKIRVIWKSGILQVIFRPEEASDVPDDSDRPKLGIIHYDSASTSADTQTVPPLVVKLFDNAGTSQSYRIYKNNVLFLVADSTRIGRMVDVVQRHLALDKILDNPSLKEDLSEEQKKRLRDMRDASEIDVRIAITRAYRYIYYPSDKGKQGLDRFELPAQDQGRVKGDQTGTIITTLTQLEKLLTGDSKPMAPQFVNSRAWVHGQDQMTTQDMKREFAKRTGLKILLDPDQLKKTIRMGVSNGIWIYHDLERNSVHGPGTPEPFVKFTENDLLYTEAKARELKIWPPVKETAEDKSCPLCYSFPCKCGDKPGGGTPVSPSSSYSETGSPAKAFQAILDKLQDDKVEAIRSISIIMDEKSTKPVEDIKLFGLAIPQIPKSGELRISLEMQAQYPGGDHFRVSFQGDWDRYRRLKSLTDAVASEAESISGTRLSIRKVFTDKVNATTELQAIKDILASMGIGRVLVQVER